VTVVATAMTLPDSARASLSAQLGPGYIVVDMHAAPASADVLLVPPVSPQLIGHLRSAFPRARIVAAEFEDETLGISYRGAIRRMLDAGAESYLASSTIPQLARQLDHVVTARPAIDPPRAQELPRSSSSTRTGRPVAIDSLAAMPTDTARKPST
jgi:hypothetical protein